MALLRDTAVQHRLGDLLARHMAAANLLGRTQIVQEVHRKTGLVVPISTSSRFKSHLGPRGTAKFAEDDAADLTAGFSLDLPADDAAGYLRDLTPVTKDTFDGLTAQYRRDAFTVAGVTDQRLIQQIRDALADVMQKGGTREDFEAAVRKLTTDAGVEQLAAFTLDTVFTTNMGKAYSLGRYEQQKQPETMKALPFWQYMTVGDDRVRPEHAVIDGFTARAIDPVWNKIYPPNGFNCRCIVIALLESEAGDEASESGLLRLPLLAQLKVPQPGFAKVFPIAA
jgi:SPP1 gp7 family putative phage head morphogenesis protein